MERGEKDTEKDKKERQTQKTRIDKETEAD